MKSWRIVVILLLCLVLAGSMACNVFGGDGKQEASWEQVKVVRGDLTVSVSGAGNIYVCNEENLTFERGSGRVDKIHVDIGDKVSKGEVLAELAPLDTDALELALLKAQIARDEAEYNLNQLKDVQHASYDRVKIAESQLEAAEMELAQAQEKLANETITAPFDGVVASVGAEVGDTFHSSTGAGTVIVRLIDLTTLELPVQVDEIDIPKIKLNQTAVVTIDALPSVELEGNVTAISPVPAATGGVVLYDITISLTAPEGSDLRVGMSATADITIEKRSNVLLVPTRAIKQDRQGNSIVMIQDGEQLQPRPVVTGLSVGLWTEILEGVSEGEIVLIEMGAETEPSGEPARPPGLFPGHQPQR